MRPVARLVSLTLAVSLLLPLGHAEANRLHGQGWISWLSGRAANVDPPGKVGGAFLEGGASDRRDGWRWFLDRAGHGDIVILEHWGHHVYNFFVNRLADVDSVQTFRLNKRVASFDPYVVGRVAQADGLFFAGGDQSEYVEDWKDTPLEDAINDAVADGAVVGGVSAGLAILAQFSFSAEQNTVTSAEALSDPYGSKVTIQRDFLSLPWLEGTITDSHFTERNRQGRLVTFLARIVADGWDAAPRGIGVDEDTAVLIEPNGAARVVGLESAWLFETPGPPQRCVPGVPLTYRDLRVLEVPPGGTFNVDTWIGDAPGVPTVSAIRGELVWS